MTLTDDIENVALDLIRLGKQADNVTGERLHDVVKELFAIAADVPSEAGSAARRPE
jgi:hypothetical protein